MDLKITGKARLSRKTGVEIIVGSREKVPFYKYVLLKESPKALWENGVAVYYTKKPWANPVPSWLGLIVNEPFNNANGDVKILRKGLESWIREKNLFLALNILKIKEVETAPSLIAEQMHEEKLDAVLVKDIARYVRLIKKGHLILPSISGKISLQLLIKNNFRAGIGTPVFDKKFRIKWLIRWKKFKPNTFVYKNKVLPLNFTKIYMESLYEVGAQPIIFLEVEYGKNQKLFGRELYF